ncbi:MAG: hypothetical protein UT55_C0050G0007 [Candidatus Peregrinibacteria bacterium GW2011_GWE2_39_6]|nr:MAG: hypothetical protein UT36_C0001G0113 [Candidatus Peregrinibacteria bacterium GW2011_GWF2_39_17]KKR25055.1 MAG: hypothetical protein UT55_C0050G0007 [Candidatus Peregrinibacteria bacterium GW2011_GWE2_39_6]
MSSYLKSSSVSGKTGTRNSYWLGKYGEDLAAHYLRSIGFIILFSRFRTRHGDIDLIAQTEEILVFCEVKARASQQFGRGLEAVNYLKWIRLCKGVYEYLDRTEWQGDFRVDVIEVEFSLQNEMINLCHLKDITF